MNLLPAAIEGRRRDVSARYLSGRGIEIGALHSPLWVTPRATVTYVDRMDVDGLRRHYPELAGSELCRVDVIDDGERLPTFPDGSLDFIIANHMLEHCENPLGAIRNHLARLRPGGILYYAVPDKRFTFDVDRPLTDFDHLVRDDRDGPAWSRRDHFLEYSRFVDKAADDAAAEGRARHLMEMNYSIHFHVWDEERFREILRGAHAYLGGTFRVEWLEQNENELITVLRQAGDRSTGDPLRWVNPRPPSALRGLLSRVRALLGRFGRAS